jgi:Zn-dependent peptidase ImmA (M78 family)
MKKLPKTIKIGAYDIKLKYWGELQETFGQYFEVEQTIYLAPVSDATLAADTLLHEIMHAIFHIYVIQAHDDEERTVTTLSSGLTQVFKDNPAILDYIKDTLYTKPE